MIRNHFRVMVVNLTTGKTRIEEMDGRETYVGGGGLAAMLFQKYGHMDKPWDHPEQPLIFAIGPLTGYFPLMSKTVCSFKSPYHDQYTETHAGGRSALSMRFGDMDALVVLGQAKRLSALAVGARRVEVRDAHFLAGTDALACGRNVRRMFPGSGRRSILRIGPAGENKCAYACINVDTYRHFGRMGGGAVMGAKKLKAICILGDRGFELPQNKTYPKLFKDIHGKLTETDIMIKYHGVGTAINVKPLNELKSLPWRNLQATSDPGADAISGEAFADETLLRNAACAGCPVGCIHVGFVRDKFQVDNQYLYRQVGYDYEPIFAVGSMLQVLDPFDALRIMDTVEKAGLDVMSAGVALAWATEATEKGLISEKETEVHLSFGDAEAYMRAVELLGDAANDFYALLAQGSLKAAEHYGGEDFACVLGQEMAGYATGEVFYTAQALGLRHSHLDTGGYSYDQKHEDQDVEKAISFLVEDEKKRVYLCAMVACLFSRGVYSDELLGQALESVGYGNLAADMEAASERIQRIRWQTRFDTGYKPEEVKIPKRYLEVETWKGKADPVYLDALRSRYAEEITRMGRKPEGDD